MNKKNKTTLIQRKSLLYKTAVEYGDYTINHVEGCSHGCLYPCYAMMMAKRFGKVKSYDEWIKPKIVANAVELLEKEIPKHNDKIKFVHLCFSTDPFMYGYEEISDLSLRLIRMLNEAGIRCTALTKGVLPLELALFSKKNEFGMTLISLNEDFRKKYEPFAAPYKKRIDSLYRLHKKGIKTWVSIEPYPTPNIIDQDFADILESISFVDKIIFGRLNYNAMVTRYPDYKNFYNDLSHQAIEFCARHGKEWHIKNGTMTNGASSNVVKNNVSAKGLLECGVF
ncbi:MAG: radical SAM protein [Nitrospirae bacterium]|nr:radical SAM protein [Nitrospirota bacterium]